ncbi:MAG: DJ-1/PfpI family protein [Acidobacteria bacterium]|nr:DJ-1/PfpI family protein [Acidobacteriota bacterium]
MSGRIAIVTGDGGEGYEALYAWHRFLEEGWRADVVAPSRRRLHLVMHDFEPGWDTYVERPGYGLEAQVGLDELCAEDYDALLLIGGRAPEYLRHDRRLLEVVREMHRQCKPLFAICHGIQVLTAAGVVAGRRVTCYLHVRSEAEAAEAEFIDEQAVADGHFVTAQTWESHPQFYREVFRLLRLRAGERAREAAAD